ncbi:uncharacterized protein [Amphiura filiformis]|uniref:uncharacterized protein n=1 Tax=Amphiura filiformis TaxID=82378 RepID=UPI003B221EE2
MVEGNFLQSISRKVAANKHLQEEISKKEDALEEVMEELPLRLLQQSKETKEPTDLADHVMDMIEDMNNIKDKIKSLEEAKHEVGLKFGKGPIANSLDQVLKKHHVERQAYHGKSFVGNHINKLCKPAPIQDLAGQAKAALQLMDSTTEDIPLQAWRQAAQIKAKYDDIFHSYADVHAAINQGGNLDDTEIVKAGEAIRRFLRLYREKTSHKPEFH